jgi:hypothetical protein
LGGEAVTHKEHEAEIRYALNAYTEAVRAECAAKQARERANEVLHDKISALLTEYQNASEVKP